MAIYDTSFSAFFVVFVTAVILQCGEAFVFSDDCPAPSPCSCSGISGSALLMCSNKHLTSVPAFHSSSHHTKEIFVFLNKNNLTSIRNYAFRSLSSMHATSINIQLESNAIDNIELRAFEGIDNSLTILELQHNELTSIPAAIVQLQNLGYLDITHNPLKNLAVSSMSGLGHSLQTLYIDLSPFTTWPTELGSLQKLKDLTISSMPYEKLNASNFRGFESTLEILTIDKASKLRSIPCALTNLPRLKSFYLKQAGQIAANIRYTSGNCSLQSHSVSTFTLENSNLTTFPDVLRNFPMTTSLSLRGNLLDIIEIEKVQSANRLTKVDMASNSFKRIPPALNKMVNLNDLDLSKNVIISIEDVDLSGLSKLRKLTLSDNPLRYISTHAFDNNKELGELNLANTNLQSVPSSVIGLSHLSNIDFRGVKITCGCEMSYLMNWNIKSIASFHGMCENTHAPLKTYLSSYLPLCP